MPEHFLSKVHSFNCMYSLNGAESCNSTFNNQHSTLLIRLLVCKYVINPLSGGYCGEVPPLPIPNREVKLTCADGTAMQCGRVGSRLLSISDASITKVVGAFLFFPQFCFLIAQLFPTAPPSSFTFLPFYLFTFIYFSLKNYGESSLVMFKYKVLMNGGFSL